MSPRPKRTLLVCPITATDVEQVAEQIAQAIRRGADAVELRLDYLLHDEDNAYAVLELIDSVPVPVIATCRPAWEGGRFAGQEYRRLAILHQCARAGAAWIDVERAVASSDRPAGTTILSFHDFDHLPDDLGPIVADLDASDAEANKVAFAVDHPADALRALDVLRVCDKPTIALAMGEAGMLSRVLARKYGALATFAALDRGSESAPGQPTLTEMRELYRWEQLGQRTQLCGVVGCPVGHSMSPAIHNAALAAADIDAVYLPLRVPEGADSFARWMDALLARPWLHWRGLSVTIPHKEHALAYLGLDACDERAGRIGAVNTITFEPDGSLRGDNTDYAAAIDALCSAMGIDREQLAGRRVALLGAGGAARAILAALACYQAETTVYNRTLARAQQLADEFGADAGVLDEAAETDAEILINCTPLGMHPRVDASPLQTIPPAAEVVFDTIYNPVETRLLTLARQAGCQVVTGVDMFVEQGARQFELWFHQPPPRPAMRDALLAGLNASPD